MRKFFVSLITLLMMGAAIPANAYELVAVGDIARSDQPDHDGDVADLITATTVGRFVAVGDFVYPDSTTSGFNNVYDPNFGPLGPVTLPVLGNHEYFAAEPTAEPFWTYFTTAGNAAADFELDATDDGDYKTSKGNWGVFVINDNPEENTPAQAAAALDSMLTIDNSFCEIVFYHKPIFSSGGTGSNGGAEELLPILEVAYDHGVDIIVNGHEHFYERFGKMRPDGTVGPDGVRMFTVGTGGATPRGFGTVVTGSQKRITGKYGILDFELTEDVGHTAGSYNANFREATGGTGTSLDATSSACHA